MSWMSRRREVKQLRAQLDELDGVGPLAKEYARTQQQLAEAKRAYNSRATWTPAEFDGYQRAVSGLEHKLVELQSRGAAESRAIGGFPWIENNPAVPFGSGGPAHPSQIEMGVDGALRLAPVYAAARVLADNVASLPLQVYLPDTPGGSAKRYLGPTIFNSTPDTPPMGHGPSVTGTMYDWVFQCMTSLVLEGNAFGFIATRDAYGYPTTIEWMAPHLVYVDEGLTGGMPNPLRAEYYFEGRHVPKEDMFHVRAFSVPGRTRGISPLRSFASLITQGRLMQRYGADWFDNGGFPPGVMRNTMQEVDPEQSAEIKSQLVAAIRRHQPLVIGADWEYAPITVPPSEAQFVESTRLNATQIAAVYGIPPYRIGGTRGDSLTYSNVESEQISFLGETLRPWLVRLETAFYGLLPGNRYCRFNADAMIRTDMKTRHEIYQIDRNIGLLDLDEIRQIEDRPDLPGGKGKDGIPLLISSDVARSGKAIPKIFQDDIIVLEVPAGGTPAVAATKTTETPQLDENSKTGTPDPGSPGNPPGGNGNVASSNGSSNGKANGTPKTPPASGNGTGRKPVSAPVGSGSREYSLTDVALTCAGWKSSDPLVVRAYLARAAREGELHGLHFASYTEKSLDEKQYGWLCGFVQGQGEPTVEIVASANGNSAEDM